MEALGVAVCLQCHLIAIPHLASHWCKCTKGRATENWCRARDILGFWPFCTALMKGVFYNFYYY